MTKIARSLIVATQFLSIREIDVVLFPLPPCAMSLCSSTCMQKNGHAFRVAATCAEKGVV